MSNLSAALKNPRPWGQEKQLQHRQRSDARGSPIFSRTGSMLASCALATTNGVEKRLLYCKSSNCYAPMPLDHIQSSFTPTAAEAPPP